MDDLEERLRSHARAFEGLMSLIPAKDYYGKDESITSTQWMQKKQTPEERQAAKRAKLDPASQKSAKDVMDEKARKRKRELAEEANAQSSDFDMGVDKEKPLEGIRNKTKKLKAQANEFGADEEDGISEGQALSKAEIKAATKTEKRRAKRKEKVTQKKEQQQRNVAQKSQQDELSKSFTNTLDLEEDNGDEVIDPFEHPEDRIQSLDVSGLVEEGQSTTSSSAAHSNASTASVVSVTSSTSSLPQTNSHLPERQKKRPFKIDQQSHENFKMRLTTRLEAMRAARKADGADGQPVRNRAELIESRRKKEAEKKAARKARWQEAKEDESRQLAEEQLARIRGGSGSDSPMMIPPRSPEHERNFNFGKVAWDAHQLEGNLSSFLESRKKKGKSDAKTALEAAQKKAARMNGLDEESRKDIQEKDLWLNAKKRAQGEKVHDSLDLLKKSLKRQEKQKAKSKQEWKDRITNVQHGKEAKQKKREDNLKKRRDEKGQKGKKKVKKPGQKVRRPGFEGTFKAR